MWRSGQSRYQRRFNAWNGRLRGDNFGACQQRMGVSGQKLARSSVKVDYEKGADRKEG